MIQGVSTTCSVLASESTSTASGFYEDCLVTECSVPRYGVTTKTWYAEGVGQVRAEVRSAQGLITMNLRSFERP